MDHRSGPRARSTLLDEEDRLVQRLRDGDEAAFARLVDRYHPALVRLALVYVHDRAVAEEVAQEAWLGLLEGLDRFAGRASLKTWLFSILVNCAKAAHRRETRTIPVSTLGGAVEDDAPAVDPARFLPAGHRWAGHWATPPHAWPEAQLLATETRQQVERAIAQLPPPQRAVLTLRDVEGWTAAEVCDLLAISAANQRVLLHRARSRVRRELEHALGGAEDDERGDD